MADIYSLGLWRHFRAEANFHVFRYRRGRVVSSGRGLTFWFLPDNTSIAQIPMDDRDMPFLFTGRSKDHQEATVQGVVTWRVADPDTLRQRVDFTIDLRNGAFLREPLEQIAALLVGLAQQQAARYLAGDTIEALLEAGLGPLQDRIGQSLTDSDRLGAMGLEVVTVRVADLAPTAELDRALQVPTFEALQQRADQATFERRALAVEKERAISENELQNKIELARREEKLIAQEDENARNRARGEAEARQIAADGEASRIRTVGQARAEMERMKVDIYRDLPREVLTGLAAREFAGKLSRIDHLNVTPDLLSTLLGDLAQAGTRRLERADAPGTDG